MPKSNAARATTPPTPSASSATSSPPTAMPTGAPPAPRGSASALISPTPDTSAPVRSQVWVQLPPRCPQCERRLKHRAGVLHGGVLACDSCHRLHYVLIIPQANVALMVELSRQEFRALFSRGASPIEVLQALGLEVRP